MREVSIVIFTQGKTPTSRRIAAAIAVRLKPESLVVVEGSLGLFVTVTNPNPTSGGSERVSDAPTPQDYDALSDRLMASLWLTVLEEAQSGFSSDDIILNTEPREVTILEETFTPNEPQPTSTLSLLQRVEFDLLIVMRQTIEEMVTATLDATLPRDYLPIKDTLEIILITTPEFQEDDSVTWEIKAQRQIFTTEDKQEVIRQARGMEIGRAQQFIFEALELQSPPEITVSPPWWAWLPFLEMRITTNQ